MMPVEAAARADPTSPDDGGAVPQMEATTSVWHPVDYNAGPWDPGYEDIFEDLRRTRQR